MPDEKGPNPQRDIKDAIDAAIEEIENTHNAHYGNAGEFALLPVYEDGTPVEEGTPILRYLDNCYLKVELKGSFAADFIAISKNAERKQLEAQKRKAKIEDTAKIRALEKKIEREEKAEGEGKAR